MERRETVRALRRLRTAKHGQYIYAYCHVRTKQVLYSLDRTLGPSALKQLPDIGANHTPPTLRKDVWRPLFSVQLPDTPAGRAQGIHAYRMLREYRMLHETNWEPPMELSLRTNRKRRDAIKKRLEERGGSKTEKVHDILKREKKKLRKRIIMDQKANSVADLAAVLLEQSDKGEALQQEKDADAAARHQEEVTNILEMAKNSARKIEKRIKQREVLEADLNEGRSSGSARRRIRELSREIEQLRFAAAAVAWVQLPESRREQEVQYWNRLALDDADWEVAKQEKAERLEAEKLEAARRQAEEQEKVADKEGADASENEAAATQSDDVSIEKREELEQQSIKEEHGAWARKLRAQGYDGPQIAVSAKTAGHEPVLREPAAAQEITAKVETPEPKTENQAETEGEGKTNKQMEADSVVDYANLLPLFPHRFDPANLPLRSAPKKGPLREEIKRRNRPVFTTEGVTVRWADILDAEFAEEWPSEVQHERMGIVRNTHSVSTAEPLEDPSAFKALQWKHRKESWELEPDTLTKVQEIRAKMGLVEEPLRPSRLINEEKLNKYIREQLESSELSPAQLLEKMKQHSESAELDETAGRAAEELAEKQKEALLEATDSREAWLKDVQSNVLREILEDESWQKGKRIWAERRLPKDENLAPVDQARTTTQQQQPNV